jgi:hypothetical protein
MHILFVVNDPPYETERTYNALRHANALAKAPDNEHPPGAAAGADEASTFAVCRAEPLC